MRRSTTRGVQTRARTSRQGLATVGASTAPAASRRPGLPGEDGERGAPPRPRAGRSERPRRLQAPVAPLRVLVAHRHEATRAGLRMLLEEHGFEVCGESADRDETASRAADARPDACLLDAALPGGAAAAVEALVRLPDAPGVVVLAESDEPGEFFAALRAGARGYLLDDVGADELADAVRAVAAGDAVLGAPFTSQLVDAFRSTRRLASGELSPREAEVLALLGGGLTTKQVAAQLGLAPTTVRRHVSAALRKLGVADRRAAFELLAGVQGATERK